MLLMYFFCSVYTLNACEPGCLVCALACVCVSMALYSYAVGPRICLVRHFIFTVYKLTKLFFPSLAACSSAEGRVP